MTKNKTGVQVAGAGILGAVIGAAVGAGAVALSNEKNQKFIKNKFNDLKKQGQKVISDMQDKAEELTTAGKEKVEKKVNAVKKGIKAKL
ncbi:MAG: hypothetical protein QY322_04880 [bacterium]|nr:MAG: hypothetical protein QY322_04880 [bacterium]